MKSLKLMMAAALLTAVASPGFAGDTGDPSAVGLKIYGAWVSAHADCSEPVAIFSDAAATYRNMVEHPSFGSGAIPNGTYPCVIFKVSDAIKTTSAFNSTSGHCISGHEYIQDIFRNSEASSCPDGSSVSGVDNAVGAEQHPCVYFAVGGGGEGAFGPGARAIPIASAWTINADSDATFVMDFTNKMIDSGSLGNDCGVDPPVMSFR